ncbi:helix-turn-helix domain-containing protein [Motilimonas sp. 1_MG-2023]|uniref:helix-turn-helix domain-containing protein n=1 Tax=Motilimonas sp. 1_MG-2023 TaxID=3062672 RepID=UPI0026E24EFD|nr:helix-turn-helix domain-containing protein [Motilimonas sp. 1_MG-2023]MDO6528021.1 helix-turn-helix domain-containing protein [Motilimonas sp. 1_MG-2023]
MKGYLDATLADLDSQVSLSQRQIERLFKRWLEISPKQYQRILRVQKTINYLREHKAVTLVDVSQQFGFSDQAHMTREFRSIASITPSKL